MKTIVITWMLLPARNYAGGASASHGSCRRPSIRAMSLKAKIDMCDAGREDALRYLEASLEHLAEARRSLEAGEYLAAVRTLVGARHGNQD